jgi:hypothetical protein
MSLLPEPRELEELLPAETLSFTSSASPCN